MQIDEKYMPTMLVLAGCAKWHIGKKYIRKHKLHIYRKYTAHQFSKEQFNNDIFIWQNYISKPNSLILSWDSGSFFFLLMDRNTVTVGPTFPGRWMIWELGKNEELGKRPGLFAHYCYAEGVGCNLIPLKS